MTHIIIGLLSKYSRLCVVIMAAAAYTHTLLGAPYSGAGLKFDQVSFNYPSLSVQNSNYGLLSVDYSAVNAASDGGAFGFVNVANNNGWVVQNLPVDMSSGINGLSVHFDLGISGQVSSLNASIDFSPFPLTTYTAGLLSSFAVSPITMNGSGIEGPVTVLGGPPASGAVTFGSAEFSFSWQFGHVTLEEDNEQCGPGSLARSFTYLKNSYGLNIPDPNNPGTRSTPNSLVGAIDDLIGRDPGASIGYDQLMTGKLDYLGGAGLASGLLLHHHNNGDNKIGTGNFTSLGGVVSVDESAMPVTDWLLAQIRNGQDIEMVYGNRHVVTIIGGGTIGGKPWIAIQDDAKQGQAGGLSYLEGGVRFSYLEDIDKDGRLNARNLAALNDGNNINLFAAESVPEHGNSLALLVITGLILLGLRWRGRMSPRAAGEGPSEAGG